MNRIALAFLLSLAGVAIAQQSGIPVAVPPPKDTIEPIQQISPITNRIPAVRYPFAQGRLEKIDLLRQHITLSASGGPYNFKYEARTYIFLGKQKITADGLKPGDLLKVNFVTNSIGEATIRRIKAERPEPPDTPVTP